LLTAWGTDFLELFRSLWLP